MGVDWLDLTFRLEREFGIRLKADFSNAFTDATTCSGQRPMTAGDVLEMVILACEQQDRRVPHSVWNRVKRCIVHGCGAKPDIIRKTSSLVGDLGCC